VNNFNTRPRGSPRESLKVGGKETSQTAKVVEKNTSQKVKARRGELPFIGGGEKEKGTPPC